jgi:hypothetical protein
MVSERQRIGRRIARRGKQSEREGIDLLAIVTTFMLAALLQEGGSYARTISDPADDRRTASPLRSRKLLASSARSARTEERR